MTDEQELKEVMFIFFLLSAGFFLLLTERIILEYQTDFFKRPSKRSLTPNRPLYASFNEAHRHIAPPTPKLPLEETFSGDNPLTPEEIEDILSDTSQSKELKETAKCEQSHTPAAGNQIGHKSLSTSPFSPSAIKPRSKATDNALHASVSPCDSEDEDAFIGTSVSSVHEFQDHASQQDLTDGPFSNQHAITDGPDASSFYPDEGADYSLASTDDVVDDEFAFNSIKGHPNPSPVLTSSPVLSPPVASGSGNPHQQLPSSHIDDVIKKQAASNYDEVTHLSGQNGSQYPIFIDSGALPPPSIAASQPLFGTEQAIGTGSHNDGDISEISEDHFIGQDKGKTPASCLNPFHAFSATSSHPSDTNAIQPEPDNKKMFLRPQAEREVSRALHHATGLSQPSSGLIVGRTRITRIHDPNQSPYSAHTDQRQDNFYHAPAIQPDWQVTQSGIKIPVPTSPSEDEIYMEAMEPYNTLNNTRMATVASGDAEDRTGLDGDEDWRTVTDDREFPAGAVGRVMTGSSIANVSDVLLARQQRPAGRMPSTTRAWWERNANPLPHTPRLPSPPPPVFGRKQRQQEDWEEIELDPMPAPYKDFSWGRVRSERARAEEEEQHIGGRQYANLPFPLVAREDAARLQAVRRASGLEDQTLSGRVLSPGLPPSTHGASYVLPRPAVRKDSARSLFSRIKNPNFDCRNLFIPGM